MVRGPRARLWWPVAGYMAFIFALSSIADTPALPDGADKNLHALLYAGLGLLLVRAFAGGLWQPVSLVSVGLTILVAALYGASDEFHQWFVPPRAVEAADVVADTIGAGVAAVAMYVRSRAVHRGVPG